MPLAPLSVTLTDGQKLETLKRQRAQYADELAKTDVELGEILTQLAEADFLAAYLGEQPEITALRARKTDVEAKERRRQYLGKLMERLDQVIPQQPAVNAPVPGGATTGKSAGLKKY